MSRHAGDHVARRPHWPPAHSRPRRRTSAPASARAGQKELPSKYLYDDVGSALFDVICLLPEYGLTRADERILRRHAAEIVERLPTPLRGGRARQRQRPQDALDPARRLPRAARVLPPDRHLARRARDRAERELADIARGRASSRSSAEYLRRTSRWRGAPQAGRAPARAVPRQHDRQLRPPAGARASWPRCARCSRPATRCCSAPIS